VKVITVVGQIVCEVVVWRALALPVIIDDEIASQSHQPVLEIALLRVVLIQRTINPDENLLSQIFRGVGARRKTVREVVNAAGITLHNLFPRRAVACATPANQFGSFAYCQSLYSSHRLFSGYLEVESPCRITTPTKLKFSKVYAAHCRLPIAN
jgi:hypothetical protein